MKMYSNNPRKPMMGGGMAMSRMKRMSGTPKNQQGEQRNPEGPTTVGSMQGATKEQEQMQRREMLRREIKQARDEGNKAKMERFKKEAGKTGQEAMLIRGILQDMGLAGRSSGDKEPTE